MPNRPEFVPVTPDDVRTAMDAVVAAGNPLTPTAIRDELRKAGFMTDAERRAELEKVLAPLKAATRSHVKQTQSASVPPVKRENPASLPEANISPTPELKPLNVRSNHHPSSANKPNAKPRWTSNGRTSVWSS